MKVIFITTWHKACGIATYSENLINALDALGVEASVYDKGGSFDDLVRLVRNTDADVLHFQHEFGISIHNEALLSVMGKAKSQGLGVVITPHSETDLFNIVLDGVADAVILHSDPNAVHKKNTFTPFHHIPHGMPEVEFAESKEYYKRKYGIAEDAFVIGTCGFIQNRGMENIVTDMSDFVADNKDVHLHLAVSAHDQGAGMAQTITAAIKNLAARKEFLDRLIITDKFMPVEEFRERIHTFDVGFGFAPGNFISNSGLATDILACGVPFVCNDVPHFSHVAEFSHVVDTDVPEVVAKAVTDLYSNEVEVMRLRRKSEEAVKVLGYSKVAERQRWIYETLTGHRSEIKNRKAVVPTKDKPITLVASSALWETMLIWPKIHTLIKDGYRINLLGQNDGTTELTVLKYVLDGIEDVDFDDVGLRKESRLAKFNTRYPSKRISADVEGWLSVKKPYEDLLPFLPMDTGFPMWLGDHATARARKLVGDKAVALFEADENLAREIDISGINWVTNLKDMDEVLVMSTPLNKQYLDDVVHALRDVSINVRTLVEDTRTRWALCHLASQIYTDWNDILVYCLLKRIPAKFAMRGGWQRQFAQYWRKFNPEIVRDEKEAVNG